MDPIPNAEIKRALILDQLKFLRDKDWYRQLVNLANRNIGVEARDHLIPADAQPGHCIDEREVRGRHGHASHFVSNIESGDPLPNKVIEPPATASMVAISAGYTLALIAAGIKTKEACKATAQLHGMLKWPLKLHTDTHSLPHTIDGGIEMPHNSIGCGALANAHTVLGIAQEVTFGRHDTHAATIGEEIFHTLVSDFGAEVEELQHGHKLSVASLIMNQRSRSTISRRTTYRANPIFDWDAWSTFVPETRSAFVKTSADFGVHINEDVYGPLMTAITFATGLQLGALRFGENGNFGIIT